MEMYFKPSDIVWVKLGPFWWPGEVVDRTQVPEEVTESLKKEPVAIVKFFDDEEYFECVKTADCICPYNCSRKNDFIKKGMDAFRAKNPKMSSFPKDVSAAEVKTGGNANILSDPIFSPERKRNYAAEIFGNPTPKKIKESNKGRANKQAPVITHRRFLGYDDYEARVLIQCPDRFSQPDAVAEPSSESDNESTKFTCPICPFVTDGLSVLLMHTNCHVKGSKHIAGPSSLKKPQKRKRKKVLSDEDLSGEDKKTKSKKYKKKAVANNTTSADGESSDNNESPAENNSQKYKPKKKDSAHSSESTSENKKDVCIDIIADWEDESNPDTTEEADISILDSIFNKTQKSENITVMESSSTLVDSALDTTSYSIEVEKLNSTLPLEEVMQKDELKEVEEQTIDEKKEKDTSISCFDFDEDEEDTRIPNATSGRKIPRVIPISDKRKSFNFDEDLIEKEEAQKKKILKESEQLGKSQESVTKDKETEELEKTYQSLMDSTSKIELPDIPNILKSEQNFRCGKTVKYPDKGQDSLEVIDAEVIEDTKSNLEGNSTTSNQVSSESLESHIEKRKSKEKRFSSRKTRWSRRSATSQSKNEETEINELLVKYSVDAEKDEDVSQNSQANASTAHDNGKIKDVLENDESSLKCNRSVTDHSVIENEILIETIAQNEISYEEFIYPENDEIGTSSECQKVERNENVNNEKLVDDEASGFKEKHFSDDSKNSKEILDGLLIENLIVNSSLEQVAKETKTVEQLENDKSSEMSKGAKKVEENLNSNKSIDTEKLDAVLDENLVSNALKQQNEIEMVIDKPQEITVDDKNNMEIDLRKTTIGVEKLKNLPDQVKLEFISSSRISSSKILDDKDCALDSQMSESSTVRSTRRGRSRDIEMDKKGKSEKSSLLSGEVDSAEEYPPSAKRERKVGRDNEEKVKQSNLKESGKQSASSRKSSRWDRKSATRDDTRPKQNELIDNKTHTTEIVDDHKFKEESSKTCMEKRESAKSEKPREPPSSSRSSRRRKSDRNENKPFVDKEANSLKEDTSSSHRSMKIDEQQHDSRKKDKQTIDVIKIEHGTSSNRSLRSDRSSSRNVQDNRRLSEQSDVIQNQEADRSSSQNKDHSSHRSSRSHRKPSRSDHEKQSPSKPRDLEHTSSHPSSRHEENLSRSDSERQKDSPRKDKSLADNQESYSSPKLSSKKGGRYRRREHDKHHIINQKDSIKADKTQCSNKNNVHKSDNSKNDSEGTELKNTEEDVSDSGKPNETLKKSDDSEMKQTGKHEPEKVSEDSMLCKSMQVHTKFDHLKLDDTKGINKSKHTDKNEPECSMPCISFQVQTESNTLELKHIEDNKPGSTKVEDSEENSSEDQMICRRVRVQTEESKKSAHKPNLFSMYRRLKNRNMSKTEIREELKKILLDNEKKMETECEENQSSRKHIENEISLNEVNKQLTEGSFPKSFLEVEKLRMDHKETLDHSKTSTSSTNIKEKTTKSSEHLTNMDENKEKLEKITTTCKNIGSHDNTDSEDHKSSRSHSKNETTNNSVQIVSESNKKNLEESELDSGSQPCSENKGQDDMNISLELNLDKQKLQQTKEKNPAKTENVEALAEEHELRKEKAKEEEKELLDENNSNHEQYGKWYRDQSKEKTELITKITTDDLMSTDSTCHDSTTYKHEDSTCIIPKSASRIDINVEKHEIPNNRSEEPVYSDLESTSHDFTGGKHSSVVAAPEAVEIKQMKLDQVSSNTVIKNDEVTIDEKNKISSMPPENPKKKRKPSRWDQKERSQTFKDHKPIYPKAQNKAYTKEQKSSNEEFPEKQEKANKISAVYSNASLDKTSEKESTLIEQSSVIDQNESEQIESIFGSSPLPKLNEDYIFSKEECKDTLKTSNAETPDIHAPNDSFVPQYESTETDISADKKLFDNAASSLTGVSSMDLLESVESQVARITHYEEPNFDEKSNEKAKDEKQRAKVESVFETPEKKLVLSIFDTPEDKSKIDNQTPESKLPMEKTLQKIKSECTSGYQSPERIIPKAKKNYLLVDKSKLETIQKSEEILRDKQVFIQNSITSVDKTLVNEVATKLTNPKKDSLNLLKILNSINKKKNQLKKRKRLK
ncbi:hypothetical protein HHI36_017123 [Cryptolaemus montrouzieri]|uniref:PWWP domain-containing protein n=1 Tax=Cryptolaemus montrouzieri TaxID=559131 RepID=A0ABD2NMH1_9CUCU